MAKNKKTNLSGNLGWPAVHEPKKEGSPRMAVLRLGMTKPSTAGLSELCIDSPNAFKALQAIGLAKARTGLPCTGKVFGADLSCGAKSISIDNVELRRVTYDARDDTAAESGVGPAATEKKSKRKTKEAPDPTADIYMRVPATKPLIDFCFGALGKDVKVALEPMQGELPGMD